MKKKGNKQERLKHWYEKHGSDVFKKNCSVCGAEFYALFSNQLVCDNETCKSKWKAMQRETEQMKMPQE